MLKFVFQAWRIVAKSWSGVGARFSTHRRWTWQCILSSFLNKRLPKMTTSVFTLFDVLASRTKNKKQWCHLINMAAGLVFFCSRNLLVFVIVQVLFSELKPHLRKAFWNRNWDLWTNFASNDCNNLDKLLRELKLLGKFKKAISNGTIWLSDSS